MYRTLLFVLAAWLLFAAGLRADEPAPAATAKPPTSVERVAREAGKAIVVVTHTGRDGNPAGLGTGFVISADGLIATNLHVIGEARPISVQLADGRKFDVTSVHAWDRELDLAILRIAATGLPFLPLGDSDKLPTGENIVALGNPRGLKHSVVSGVVSGRRELDGRNMIQLAIPIEPGNSGGPIVDLAGNAFGIVTLKSAVSENLGFAMPVNTLKPLLEKPNPVPMSRWLTIGALSPADWKPLFGARWQQRAGKVLVSGEGEGFGGRSLCLSQHAAPERPFELAVSVKLNDEKGAAGLIFHADGGDRHYGFYPSDGRLRLTRFDGPTVFQWQVLREVASEHYHPGEWNELKVRLEKDGLIRCFVNEKPVIELKDEEYIKGSIGLAKFRTTEAEFRQFRVGATVASARLSADALAEIKPLIEKLPPLAELKPTSLAPLVEKSSASGHVLREEAIQLRARANELERLASEVHVARTTRALAELLEKPGPVDLARAALLIARLDDEELEIDVYLAELDRMAREIKNTLPKEAAAPEKLAALSKYLFVENGFHGSRTEYYHQANSYLNRVLDDREGLPIALAVLFMELGKRLELTLNGIPLPGHFVVQFAPADGEPQLIDVYDGGKKLTRAEAAELVKTRSGVELTEEHFRPATPRQILERMLRNLKGIAESEANREALLRYLEVLVMLNPENPADRGQRAVIRFETGRKSGAVDDMTWLIDHKPAGLDGDQLRAMRDFFQRGGKE